MTGDSMLANLIIRADASLQIGTGHVMRCLALAEPWLKAGSRVMLASAPLSPALAELAKALDVELRPLAAPPGSQSDAKELAQIVAGQKFDWAVIDGYHFEADYQRVLKEAGVPVLCLDDFGHAKHYCADFVLNQNLGANEALYPSRDSRTQLLLGTRFVQLRGEFGRWGGRRRAIPVHPRKILVTLGGGDHDNVTLKVIQALQCASCAEWKATVVIGGSNSHSDPLKSSIQNQESRIRLLQNAGNMPQLMAEAGVAIAGGGTTAWELAFMGLPSLMIVMADNQRSNAEQLQSAGFARNLGWHGDLTPEQIANHIVELAADSATRSAMAQNGRRLVDGSGNYRVWLRLNESSIHLRRAAADAARPIWEWANDPTVRAASFSSELISWEAHVAWFNEKLADPNCMLWIATDAGQAAAGMVRFDLQGQAAVISINLDQSRRGKNLGSLVIWVACRKLFRETPAAIVKAFIKPDHQASIRAFEKAGFEKVGETAIKNQLALLYQLARSSAEL